MKRASGVLMHVSSLYGEYSEGSFGKSAFEWIDFLEESGFTVWQTLPFCIPDEVNSPYKSYSAFSINPMFIDLPTLYEDGLLTREELEEAKQETPYSCEFSRLNEERLPLLARAAKRFTDQKAIKKFLADHPKTAKFCEFMALKEANGGIVWTEWTVKKPDPDCLALWQFMQYECFTQWALVKTYANSHGISIVGDVPIYVSHDSSDVWAEPHLFQLDEHYNPTMVAGVPPDYFSEDGQLWGNPLYDWKRMKEDGYTWWMERLAFMNELFDGVRIDHFRGLESYYAVDASETTARNGKWIKGPGMPFIREVKKICADKIIIAEDLGIITPAVFKMVRDSGFPNMRVFQFGFLGDPASPHLPHNYENNCVAYTGTHDNNTLLGYIWEIDEETRRDLFAYCGYTGDNWDGSRDAILRTVLSSSAGLAVFPIQDLLFYGSDTRLNTPGTCEDNWSYRVTREQIQSIDRKKLRKWNQLFNRV